MSRWSNHRRTRCVNCFAGSWTLFIFPDTGTGTVSCTATTVVAKPSPIHTPAPPTNPCTGFLPAMQLPSPSPSPIDNRSPPFTTSKSGTFIACCSAEPPRCSPILSVDATTEVPKNLRSLVELMMEGTRQTDRLILDMRNILAGTDTTGPATFEAWKDEEDTYPTPLASSSTQSLAEHPRPFSMATPISTSPCPSTSPPPSTRLDLPLRIPITRGIRHTSPLPSAVNQLGETTKGSHGTHKFNCEVPLIADTIHSTDSSVSNFKRFGSLGSPMLDPSAIGEEG